MNRRNRKHYGSHHQEICIELLQKRTQHIHWSVVSDRFLAELASRAEQSADGIDIIYYGVNYFMRQEPNYKGTERNIELHDDNLRW